MCGIAGLMNADGGPLDLGLLQRMTRLQFHRGPDGEGYVLMSLRKGVSPLREDRLAEVVPSDLRVYSIGFGHRRLAVVDVSSAGHQPMGSSDGRYWVTYNGEIYNYVELREELRNLGHAFHSQSDTEVLLSAYRQWGDDCLARFNGMFAFALWDAERRRLFCARDRFGVKPFYYTWQAGRFMFASEIKSLLLGYGEPKPNQTAVFRYLEDGCLDDGPGTFFTDVHQLLPAHTLVVEKGRLATRRYWDLPEETEFQHGEQETAQYLAWLLRDAVRLRLRSDVPVASCLSGGLDSSAVVCLANRILKEEADGIPAHLMCHRQKTFSSCAEDPRYDERPFIHRVVEATDVDPHYVFPDHKDLCRSLKELVWHHDEPFGSTSIFAQWAVMRHAAERGIKVMLDGQGADELLAGYHGFFGALFADLIATGRWGQALREYRSYRARHAMTPPQIAANFTRAFLPEPWVQWGRSHLTGTAQWIHRDLRKSFGRVEEPSYRAGSHLRTMQRRLLFGNGLRALLHHEDRNSMAFGMEARLPFLDFRVAEFLYRLPPQEKLSDGWTKIGLRRAMAGIVPDQVVWRVDKMGFVTPEHHWFKTALKPLILDMLSDGRCRQRGYLDVKAAASAFQAYLLGRKPLGFAVWRWLNLELWSREFVDQQPCEKSLF